MTDKQMLSRVRTAPSNVVAATPVPSHSLTLPSSAGVRLSKRLYLFIPITALNVLSCFPSSSYTPSGLMNDLVPAGSYFSKISSGESHTCGIHAEGSIKEPGAVQCWGTEE
jgi:hypothetical protein